MPAAYFSTNSSFAALHHDSSGFAFETNTSQPMIACLHATSHSSTKSPPL